MKLHGLELAGASVLSIALLTTLCFAQTSPHHADMPTGPDFPVNSKVLLDYVNSADSASMRKHSWLLFLTMTQKLPTGEALWESWYPSDVTFAAGPSLEAATRHRIFHVPRQIQNSKGEASPHAVGASDLSFVMLNPKAHSFIRANKYNLNSTFDQLVTAKVTDVAEFPPESMSLKAVWWPIKQDGLTPMPIWDDEPTKPIDVGMGNLNPGKRIGNTPRSWKRIVFVDPKRSQIPDSESATGIFSDPTSSNPDQSTPMQRRGRVVALNSLYHFTLTDADLQGSRPLLNRNFRGIAGRDAKAGDMVALVCLHVTTKEIPNWTWQTFWWHDKPNSGPFAADRPASLLSPWQNYLMNVAYDTDTPKNPDGTPHACFNPWLEARFANGVKSNCMTCHQRAVWPLPENDDPGIPEFLPVTVGGMKKDDPYFKGHTRLDFLWSMAFESK